MLIEYTDGTPAYVRWIHPECLAAAQGIRDRAMSVDPKRTGVILDRIAAKKAEVPSPLPSIRRPRAWLTRMPWRVHVAMLGQVQTMFCAQLARFAIAQCRSWLVAKITLKVSIVPQVAASLVEALPGEKRKTTHKDGKGDAKKLRISSQVCIPESGGTHPAGAHSFARVRSHCTRAQPRTHTLAC